MAEIEAEYRGRIVSLDLARGLAIVFMVFQHAVLIYAVDRGEQSVVGKLVLLFGSAPAAPVFLFIMGIFLGRPDRGLRRGVRRGIKLIVLGYLLNLLRSTLPSLIAGQANVLSETSPSPLASFWAVDVLQMAGLSFILLTLLKTCVPSRWMWATLAAGVAFVSPLLWHFGGPSGIYALWGAGDNVFFSLLPWIAYPLVGMVYSPYALATNDRGVLTKRMATVGGLLLAVGVATSLLPAAGGFDLGAYFRNGPGAQLAVVGFIFMWLPACGVLARRWAGSTGLGLLCFWSRYVTPVYFVQWVLIGWAVLLLGRNRYASPVAVAIGAVTLLVTHAAVRIWTRRAADASDRVGTGGCREI